MPRNTRSWSQTYRQQSLVREISHDNPVSIDILWFHAEEEIKHHFKDMANYSIAQCAIGYDNELEIELCRERGLVFLGM